MKKHACGKISIQTKFFIYLFLIVMTIVFSSCSKQVYTTFYEEEDFTEFKTHPFKVKKGNKEPIQLIATRRCDGQTLCSAFEIKILLIRKGQFTYLKGKDFIIEADDRKYDLNKRSYKFTFDAKSKNSKGITGVITEIWTVYVSIDDYQNIMNSSSIIFLIGDEKYLIDQEKLESWRILIDHPKLVQQMDQEHQRIYKDSQGIPSTKSKQNNIIETSMKQDAEKETWELIQDSNNIEDIEYFLNNFPNSSYVLPAKLKLKQLKRNEK